VTIPPYLNRAGSNKQFMRDVHINYSNYLIVKPVTDANGTKIAHFDFLVEDYRGFDISKGIAGNPTIGFISPQSNNKSINK
jgi:hypothetical protein